MHRRSLLALFAAFAFVAAGCGDDDTTSTEDTTTSTEDTAGDDAAADPVDDDGGTDAALCDAYFALVDDVSVSNAQDLLDTLEQPMPPGVQQELDDIVDGVATQTSSTQGYVGPICGHDAAVDDHGPEGDDVYEGEVQSTVESVCLDLFDAWSTDDRASAEMLGEADAIDDLFAHPFSPPAGSGVRMNDVGDCFYAIPDGVAEVAIADSDLEAFVIGITWYPDTTFFDDAERADRFDTAS